ncbi:MAG: hypothetical protein JW760_13485 [Spirochaetales bacterium]|nr:hypothetical protein [Spirochaetales bacterium]
MIHERMKKIEGLKAEVRTKSAERAKLVAELGKALWERKGKGRTVGSLDSLMKDLDRKEEESKGYRKAIGDIRAALEKKELLEKELSALKEEQSGVEREFQEAFEGLGRSAYRVFSEKEPEESSMTELLKDLGKNEVTLAEAEEELKRFAYTAQSEGLFKKLAEKSKEALVASKARAARGRLAKLYRELGKMVAQSAITEQEYFREVFQPHQPCIDGMRNLRKKEEEITAEKVKTDEQLALWGVEKNGKKRISELDERVKETEKAKEELFLSAGTAFLAEKGKVETGKENQAIRDLLKNLDALAETLHGLEDDIMKEETFLRIDSLKHTISDKDLAIQTARDRIEKLNAELKEQQKIKKQLQSEIKHLEESLNPEEPDKKE